MRREFPASVKRAAWDRATDSDGVTRCEEYTAPVGIGNVHYDGEYDHDLAAWLGGSPTLDNCIVRCKTCHKRKTKRDVKVIAKTKRLADQHRGINRKPSQPLPCGKNSGWKMPMRGWHAERRL
jgi:hypothetical protein